MNKGELLAALQTEHEAMERAIMSLAPEQMAADGALANGWSVKDLLAHIAAWEAEMVSALFHAVHGRTPSLGRALQDIDAWNAERHAENAGRPLDRVLADWRGVRHALMQRVKGWAEEELGSEVSWHPGHSLVDLIKENSYGHEAEHRGDLEAYCRRVTA
jgi:hypothetical protein